MLRHLHQRLAAGWSVSHVDFEGSRLSGCVQSLMTFNLFRDLPNALKTWSFATWLPFPMLSGPVLTKLYQAGGKLSYLLITQLLRPLLGFVAASELQIETSKSAFDVYASQPVVNSDLARYICIVCNSAPVLPHLWYHRKCYCLTVFWKPQYDSHPSCTGSYTSYACSALALKTSVNLTIKCCKFSANKPGTK